MAQIPIYPYAPYSLIFVPILLIDLHDYALMRYNIIEGFCLYLYSYACEVVKINILSWFRAKGLGSGSLASQHGRRKCVYKRTCPPTILSLFLFSLHSYLFILLE
jgi:hypothetical protein